MNDFIRQLPHPAHFISWRRCAFRLTTYVNGWIVSSVGEWHPKSADETAPPEAIGGDGSIYEVQVFHAIPAPDAPCCGYDADTNNTVDQRRAKTAVDAARNHEEMIQKYAAEPFGLIAKAIPYNDEPTQESCDARRP